MAEQVPPYECLLIEAIGTPRNGRNDGPAPARLLAVFLGAEGVGNSEKVE